MTDLISVMSMINGFYVKYITRKNILYFWIFCESYMIFKNKFDVKLFI